MSPWWSGCFFMGQGCDERGRVLPFNWLVLAIGYYWQLGVSESGYFSQVS